MTTPYTYHLYHIPTGLHYYGVRWAKNCSPSDLWSTYFSSSKTVKKLIKEYGLNSFIARIRKTFNTKEHAILWEEKVLKRLKANTNPLWLNKNISGSIVNKVHPLLGKPCSEETKQKISKSNKGKPKWSDQDKLKMSKNRSGNKHWNFGNKWSDETKEKNKQSNIAWRKNNPEKASSLVPPSMLGRNHSDETKKRMSEARKNYWLNKTASISAGT